MSVPKVGIIYNDLKPVAYRIATELQDKLSASGWEVCMATGVGGILGYSRPDSPVWLTPIDMLSRVGLDV